MTTKSQSTTTKLEASEPTLEPCPLSHYVHAGLRAHKTGLDPGIVCLDCGLTLRAPDWIKVYERWQSRVRVSANTVPAVDKERMVCDCHTWPTITEMHAYVVALETIVRGTRPEHKCRPIARAVMDEGRDWWIGELLEPLPEWPREFYCLHMKTPVKNVAFLCNAGDFEQLMVLSNAVTGLKNLEWLESMTKGATQRAAASPVAPQQSRTPLDEIEVALISIADGVSPQEAVGKAFNIINHERARLNAAASVDQPRLMLHYFTPSEKPDCCFICERGVLEHPETPKHNAPAPSAAIQDETPTFRSTKEAMLYAQRHGIPSVIPAKSSYSEGVAARVAPSRTALDEIEVALISIADGVSPQEAVGKAFNIINHERVRLNAAASVDQPRLMPHYPPSTQDDRCKCGLDKDDPIHWFSTDWQPTHKFTPRPTALNLSSRARKATEEIFEFGKYDLEPERAKDQITTIILRCLSEGEA